MPKYKELRSFGARCLALVAGAASALPAQPPDGAETRLQEPAPREVSPRAIDADLERLQDLDARVRTDAFRSLVACGRPAIERALTPPWPAAAWARRLRVELFRRDPAPDLLARLEPLRLDAAAEVRRALAEALGERALFSSSADRELWLEGLLEDPVVEVRRAALRALGAIDRASAAEALVRSAVRAPLGARVEILRALTGLRAARPLLLDARRAIAPSDRVSRLELGYALGGAALHALAAGRLRELVDAIAADLASADVDLRAAGEAALRVLAAELRAATEWRALEQELARLASVLVQRSLPLERWAVLRAFGPAGTSNSAAHEVVSAWRARFPDARTPEGRDAVIRGGLALGLGALLRGEHDAALRELRTVSEAIEIALLRLPADRWGGWPVELRLPHARNAERDAGRVEESELELDPEVWDQEIARRGLERRRPVFHFDHVQRDLLREDARARFTAILAACLDPSLALDPEAEARAALERLLEAYALSVSIEGNSFRAMERLPSFGENVDLVFDGETGLYELLYALVRRGRAEELPAALARFAAAIEAQGPWAAREIASPSGHAYEPESLDLETFVRYRRRNPSRFRIVWGQLLLDACGAPEAALKVYEEAIAGYGASTRDWPWAARLEAQAVQGLASCHMARRDAAAVEVALARGLARLEELRRSLEVADGPGAGDWLGPDIAGLYVSRAVNENVLNGRPELGMQHMRRALELDPSDFNWILMACYLARAGGTAEARAILARVPPQPAMAYNRGCALALLGEHREALAWLAVDLEENHASPESKRQQARWAWDDPDLRSLREEPRFAELYGARR